MGDLIKVRADNECGKGITLNRLTRVPLEKPDFPRSVGVLDVRQLIRRCFGAGLYGTGKSLIAARDFDADRGGAANWRFCRTR